MRNKQVPICIQRKCDPKITHSNHLPVDPIIILAESRYVTKSIESFASNNKVRNLWLLAAY